ETLNDGSKVVTETETDLTGKQVTTTTYYDENGNKVGTDEKISIDVAFTGTKYDAEKTYDNNGKEIGSTVTETYNSGIKVVTETKSDEKTGVPVTTTTIYDENNQIISTSNSGDTASATKVTQSDRWSGLGESGTFNSPKNPVSGDTAQAGAE
ncbi:MAG: hypothetical protein JXN62_07390, partial [Bacteroidales bacterium]|nr:hypothetical protein [Bacteroidales bacterium]